jgi:hypothetical protein
VETTVRYEQELTDEINGSTIFDHLCSWCILTFSSFRFYHRKLGKRDDYGDISKQKKLRKDLQCKSFDWFIKNVYPDVQYPKELRDPEPKDNRNQTNVNNVKPPKRNTKVAMKKRKKTTTVKVIDEKIANKTDGNNATEEVEEEKVELAYGAKLVENEQGQVIVVKNVTEDRQNQTTAAAKTKVENIKAATEEVKAQRIDPKNQKVEGNNQKQDETLEEEQRNLVEKKENETENEEVYDEVEVKN